jgi:hypothetical protein
MEISMSNHLKELTNSQLKHYLSEHRTEDELFSQALAELMSRDPNPVIYPADLSIAEIEQIVSDKIRQTQQADS